MDIRVLRYFLAVAREENITKAAQSLHITQPSLSKQLMELEAEVGRKLLVRGKKKVTLTQEGHLLRKRAEELVALMEKTERELASDDEELSGELYIGGSATASVLEIAAQLRKEHEGVRFHFYSGDATDVLERLDHGNLDFAVMLEPIDTVKYDFISLSDSSEWGLLMESGCELAKGKAVSREELVRAPLILHQRIGLQEEIAHWAQISLERMNIVATYNVVHGSPIAFVESGLGYFLTTRDLLAPRIDDSVCFRPLNPPLITKYALVWKKHAVFGKVAEAFLERMKFLN